MNELRTLKNQRRAGIQSAARSTRATLSCLCLAALAACGGGGGSSGDDDGDNNSPTYTLGGTVSGLNGSLTMANGGATTTVSTNGTFNFTDKLAAGTAYAVSVSSQPTGQTCTVGQGTGTVGSANVNTVQVNCADNPINTHALGGSVSGLTGTVVLVAGTHSVTVTADGPFTFSESVPSGTSYVVSVQSQPSGQSCTVTGGSGTMGDADVTSVVVTCSTVAAATATAPRLSASTTRSGMGDGYTLAARADGTLYVLGSSSLVYLIGDSRPLSNVAGTSARTWSGRSASSVAAGSQNALFVSNGTVQGWGLNDMGSLGGEVNLPAGSPVALAGVSNVVAAVTIDSLTIALRSDGTLWHWPGVVTYTTTGATSTPRQISGLSGVWRVVEGPTTSTNSSRLSPLFIKTDGTVWTLDSNVTTTSTPTGPVQTFGYTSRQITGLGSVDDLACQSDCLVLRRDGSVALWSNAQIPSGGTTVAVTATDVAGLSNIVSVAKTNNASVAVEADGSLWTWGNPGADTELGAGHGQAGNAVIGSPSLLSRLSGAKEASCSYIHCAVRLTNGQLWSWGRNSNGELGDGTTTNRFTPVQATGLSLN